MNRRETIALPQAQHAARLLEVPTSQRKPTRKTTFRSLPERYFEVAGVCIGFTGPVLIAFQIRAEWLSEAHSTLSPAYLAGFLGIYLFWFVYGLRFGRFAVWFGNLLAVALQAALFGLVLWK